MQTSEMFKLIERIRTEPSVLFLGQEYLSSLTGKDIFYNAINSSICGGRAPATPCYENLWKYANSGQALTADTFSNFYREVLQLPTQQWLRSILSMRWGMVYTSAVDACLTHCVGPDFTFNSLGPEKIRFRREYMSKTSLHGIYLYGSVDGADGNYPPALCDSRSLRRVHKRVNDRINWIYNDILRDYGVLVIDGWHPNRDWASDLLVNACDMCPGSIYLFGADQEIEEDEIVAGLVEDKIVTLVPRTFASMLEECGYLNEELSDFASSEERIKTITLRNHDKKESILTIPCSAVDTLDSHITLMDDDLGYENRRFDHEDISERFARYLQQGATPIWSLCIPENGFHFHRKIDDELYAGVTSMMKKGRSNRSNVLILEGVSNSGKTAALIHLAMILRQEQRCPVLYISGKPTQTNFDENLKGFIKRYLSGNQTEDGSWIDRVVIVWDGNLSEDALGQYRRLSHILAECNTLIIGSVYRHEGDIDVKTDQRGVKYLVPVKATLDKNECKALEKLLKRVDGDLLERFQEILRTTQDPNIIYILQKLSMYRHCQEWRDVAAALTRHFYLEVDYNENKVQKQMKEYAENISEEQVHEAIVSRGVAAAWQLQLQNYLKELRQNDVEEDNADEQNKQIERLNLLQEDVQRMSEVLAVAGQFSVSLPVTLILNMLRHRNILSQENKFLNDVLATDSLIEYSRDEQGYPYVRFRHPSEAELYIRKNFGENRENIRKQEVGILCEIIKSCRWDEEESYDVVDLIRCFGPNSRGKYSQHVEKGSYFDYMPYLSEITDCLQQFATDNPEAVLVYAHFLREKAICDRSAGENLRWQESLGTARRALQETIRNHDQHNYFQYNRLLVELCSNLVASMPRKAADGPFSRETFRDFQNIFHTAINTWSERSGINFSTNSLLDIWLNAITNFLGAFTNQDDALADEEFVVALSDSLNYIDRLFEIDINFDSIRLLEKIDLIYHLAFTDKMNSVSEKLSSQNNDTFLYLIARRCWISEKAIHVGAGNRVSRYNKTNPKEVVRSNLFFLPDDADAHDELRDALPELRTLAVVAAQKAVSLLEENMELIRKSKSSRCLEMLIRAKWLIYTGRMPLEEKQRPNISVAQWEELYDLCTTYEQFCAVKEIDARPCAQMFRAIYLWAYTPNVMDANRIFADLRQKIGYKWFIERIGLCVPKTKTMRRFRVNVRRTPNGKYDAEICHEFDMGGTEKPMSLCGRFNIHVSDRMIDYLFDGQKPCMRYNIQKPVVIWFNAAGAVLDVPHPGRKAGGAK